MTSINMTVTPLEMPQIQKLTDSLYVLNNSDLGRTQTKGVIHLLINDASGQEVQINIPKTWIPVNLGDYCDVPSIIKSSKFRELVRKGILVAISDTEAGGMLNSSRGVEEKQKVHDEANKVASAVRNSFASAGAAVVQHGTAEAASNGAAPPINGVATKEIKVDDKVRKIINDYLAGASDSDTADLIRDTHGTKDSWIWASSQIKDTSSTSYLAISDKIADFDDSDGNNGSYDASKAAPAAPTGSFVVNVG